MLLLLYTCAFGDDQITFQFIQNTKELSTVPILILATVIVERSDYRQSQSSHKTTKSQYSSNINILKYEILHI